MGHSGDDARVDKSHSVRHYRLVEYAGFSWTASARRHRVTRAQVKHVVERAGGAFVRSAVPPERPDEALLFLGDDPEGVEYKEAMAWRT